MEIVYLPTGQKIYFRGSDESSKIKGLKTKVGYIAVVWFEEMDQFDGMDEIRMIKQSAIRGGNFSVTFMSYNPPRSSNNWINKYVIEAAKYEGTYIHHSTYLTVPREWLGDAFLKEAELQKKINEKTYNHEYMGEVVGTGDQVFDNLEIRPISDSEIASYNNRYYGLDFGYKDPTAFNAMSYDHEKRILYIYDEWHEVGLTNVDPIDKALRDKGIPTNTRIVGDSASPDKIAGLNNLGWFGVIGAIKGHGSLKLGYDFLVGLNKIVIDNGRCPNTAREFASFTFPRNRQGDLINVYPEGVGVDDHHMAAVRYALEAVWRNKYSY
jgi:phage terminase large subunit